VLDDLLASGEICEQPRAYRLMRQEKLLSQTGYRRKPSQRGGSAAVMALNHLRRQFDVREPNSVWVTVVTYTRTHEGSLFLCAVLDLF
jgi:putative transposase